MFKTVLRLVTGIILSGILTGSAFAEMIYNRGNLADPESLDPHKTSTVYEAHILRDLFEGLVMPDAKSNLIPGAAESWTISNDGKVYTFKLRQDAVWSNGDLVTADDFVYAFQRLENPDTAAEYASMLYVVENAEEVNAGKAKPEELGIRALDEKTLEITLKAPTPYFLELLTHQSTYPVNRASLERLGANWIKPGNLISNGAFTLTEWVPNDHIKLNKNPKFHDAANVRLDVVNYYPSQDRSAAVKRFEAGELDSNDDFPTEQLAGLERKLGDQVRVGPYLGTYYFHIKLDKEPWSNPKLRRAISMAIDRRFLAEKVRSNSMFPAYGMVPPGIEGYQSYQADYAAMPEIDREDEAAMILKNLGYGADHPLKLGIRYDTSDDNRNTMVAIQEQLRPLGIEISLLNLDAKTHFSYLENKGDFDFAVSGWIADYKDPESFLGISRKASGNNYGNYDSPEFERLMDSAAAAGANPTERMKLLAESEKVLVNDLGVMPLLFFSYHNLVSSKLEGWEPNVMDIHPSRFISIDR